MDAFDICEFGGNELSRLTKTKCTKQWTETRQIKYSHLMFSFFFAIFSFNFNVFIPRNFVGSALIVVNVLMVSGMYLNLVKIKKKKEIPQRSEVDACQRQD